MRACIGILWRRVGRVLLGSQKNCFRCYRAVAVSVDGGRLLSPGLRGHIVRGGKKVASWKSNTQAGSIDGNQWT